jgi:hypothetical protein
MTELAYFAQLLIWWIFCPAAALILIVGGIDTWREHRRLRHPLQDLRDEHRR